MCDGFKNKVVLVTGGSRGIGYAIAKEFIAQGAKTIITSRSLEQGKIIAKELITKENNAVFAAALDLSNPSLLKEQLQKILTEHSAIDILVNNAGITQDNLLLRMKDDQWDAVIQSNLSGAFHVSKACIRGMLKKKFGRIIHISSVIGEHGNAGQSNYAASKGGLIAFSKSLARELAAKNITSNVISPGFIETKMTEALPEKQVEAIIQQVPVKRMGKTSEIAKAVLFFASDDAAYITGQSLAIDGGLYI